MLSPAFFIITLFVSQRGLTVTNLFSGMTRPGQPVFGQLYLSVCLPVLCILSALARTTLEVRREGIPVLWNKQDVSGAEWVPDGPRSTRCHARWGWRAWAHAGTERKAWQMFFGSGKGWRPDRADTSTRFRGGSVTRFGVAVQRRMQNPQLGDVGFMLEEEWVRG